MQGDLFGFDGTGWRPVRLHYNVKLFGAVGDGTTDDTVAIQRALDAAGATTGAVVYFPPGTYKITAALTLPNGSGGFTHGAFIIQGAHRDSTCIEQATSNTPILTTLGLTYSTNVKIRDIRLQYAAQQATTDTSAYAIAWDGNPFPTIVSWTIERCWINRAYVAMGIKATSGVCSVWNLRVTDTWITSTRHTAVKLSSPVAAGMPSNHFEHLYVANTGVGGVGGAAIVSNGPAFDFAAATVAMTDIDLEGWYNNALAYNGNTQALAVRGFYIEHHHFDNTSAYGVFPVLFDLASDAHFDSVIISADTTGVIGAYMFNATSCNLYLRGVATHLTIGGGGGATAINASGTSRVFYNNDWRAAVGAIAVPFDAASAAFDTLVGGVRTLTYSGTIATDASVASQTFRVIATNGTAFTLSTPTNPVQGQRITYDIKNSSGGAHGVITWGAGFLNGGAGTVGTGALAGIANGKRRTISFFYDGTNWIELYRTADQ